MSTNAYLPRIFFTALAIAGFFFIFSLVRVAAATLAQTTPKDCSVNGTVVRHGESRKFYKDKIVPFGESCEEDTQVRTCSNGVMSGSSKYSYPVCVVEETASGKAVREPGYVYIKTSFDEPSDSPDRFSRYWNTVNCNTQPHEKDTLGTLSRKGACMLKKENGNGFVRFTIYPFDVRGISDENRDYGKGGGESAPREVLENAYGYRPEPGAPPNAKGWDAGGTKYMIDGNTVRYSWRFRIQDLSLLEDVSNPGKGLSGVWATAPLSQAAVIGQFHGRERYTNPSTGEAYSCGGLFENTHSPHLSVNVQGDEVVFGVLLKLRESLIPAYLQPFKNEESCEFQTDKGGSRNQERACPISVWRKSIPKQDVVGKWFKVEFDVKLSQKSAGSIAFSFGRKDLPPTHVAGFQRQKLLGALSRDVINNIPTKASGCPNTPRIGVYALQYNPLYYVDYQNEYTGPRNYSELDEAKELRKDKPRSFISNAFKKTFLDGSSNPLKTTPKFVIDYDDYSITQLSDYGVSSQMPQTNLANVLTGFKALVDSIKKVFE